jgi:hypothetical protein
MAGKYYRGRVKRENEEMVGENRQFGASFAAANP